MEILSGLFSKTKSKERIVDRLLEDGSITSKEAVILLKSVDMVYIGKVEVSSGSKIVSGVIQTTNNNLKILKVV